MDEDRYPISTYITSVLWSDQNEIVVYRSFADFEKMHKQIKKAFPPTSPMKKSSRIIPKFKDHSTKSVGQKKGPSRSVVRLKFLEKYCEELLSCDPRVTQSPDLKRFFHPTDQDLKPEYSKNSIMVMPSDDVTDAIQDRTHGVGNVTQPFVTETYRCVALYETKDTKNKPFKVALDEKVDVLIKDKAGWWLVENEDKRLAWFPAPYLEKLDDDEDDEGDEAGSPTGIGALYTAVKTYKATKGDEVSVSIGSVVEVLQKSDNGWWLIRCGGKVGYVPTLFLQPYNNPRVRMASLQQDLRGSNLNLNLSQLSSPTGSEPNQRRRSHGDTLQLSQLQAPNLGGNNPNQRKQSQGYIMELSKLHGPSREGHNPNKSGHSQGNILQVSQLQAPSRRGSNPGESGHSQGNILQQRLGDQHRSRSVEVFNYNPPQLTKSHHSMDHGDGVSPSAAGVRTALLPVITVEGDEGDIRYRSHTLGSQESQDSLGSLGSDSSDFSDDLNSSNGSFTLNLAQSLNEQQLRLSRTPPPPTMSSNYLSPVAGKITPSVSDPNLYKGSSLPKVPPRPRAQEILTRCTTVTRKNAAKGGSRSPTLSDIQSR
ncbi:hypothetical protein NHX12_032495 [Muraenolepis orangiensis]|uniref:NADPH oxidase organizer 1 n=1 Tax=Muraenolepis orangiensis TaxID=630683 RepID=A0A9Q0IIC8_9TELE|nr:hypothetical protein NHX12_032495 [Muraenolepis orangiensis]